MAKISNGTRDGKLKSDECENKDNRDDSGIGNITLDNGFYSPHLSKTEENKNGEKEVLNKPFNSGARLTTTTLETLIPSCYPTISRFLLDRRFEEYYSHIYNPIYWRGILYPGLYFSTQVFSDLCSVTFQPDDIVIATFPRSGTTWTAELVSCLMNRKDLESVRTSDIGSRVHHIEAPPGLNAQTLKEIPAPRIFQTHLQYQSLPPSVLQQRCKIIYAVRNPKDVAVSFYHHHRSCMDLGNFEVDFKSFLPLFLEGKVVCGSWFDHVTGYWAVRELPNILILQYENMVKELEKTVLGIADFLGIELSRDELTAIKQQCTFDHMKQNKNVNREMIPTFDQTKSTFIRKGIIGDWKNHFEPLDEELFDLFYKIKHGSMKDLNFNYTN